MKELNKSGKPAQIAIHLFVWLFLFSMPYFLTYNKFENIDRLIEHTWFPLCLYAISFYLNYFWITDKLFDKKKRYQFILINLLLIVVLLVINFLFRFWFFQKMPPPDMPPHMPPFPKDKMMMHKPLSFFMYTDSISYLIPIMFAIGIRAIERWSKAELQQKTSEKERLSSELQHLKYQLQPHFFFNSLNNIYSLVDINPEQAKEGIHTLSKLMRYMLYESDTEKVSLKQEMDFMQRYIQLMSMRCSDKTTVSFDFPELKSDISIPPLLFISLIENAFKHGVSATANTNISFKIRLENKMLSFEAKNDNLPKQSSDKSGSGIGLDNLQKRLDLLFPAKYSFSKKVIDSQYIVRLSLIIHE